MAVGEQEAQRFTSRGPRVVVEEQSFDASGLKASPVGGSKYYWRGRPALLLLAPFGTVAHGKRK